VSKKIITDSIYLMSSSFLLKFKGIILVPILIMSVGLGDYGAYIQIMTSVALIAPLCQMGLGQIFYRFTSRYKNEQIVEISSDYWFVMIVVMLLSLSGAGLIFISSDVFSKAILDGFSTKAIQLSSLFVITTNFYSVNNTFIQSRKQFKFYVLFNLVYEVAPYLIFILVMVLHEDLFIGLLSLLCSQLILNTILFAYIKSSIGIKIVKPCFKETLLYLRYSLPLTLSSITGGLLSKADTYFIGYFLGKEAIGIYGLVYTISLFIDQVSVPFLKYFQTYSPKEWDDGYEDRVILKLKTGLVLYFAFAVGLLSGLVCFAQPLVFFIFKKDISQFGDLQLLILIIGLGIIAFGISRIYYQLFNYQKKTHRQLYIQLFGLLINLVANYYLIPIYGLLGAAWTTLGSYLLVIIACSYRINLNLSSAHIKKLALIFISGLIVTATFFNRHNDNLVELLFGAILAAILYVLLMLLFKIIDVVRLLKAA